LQVATSENDSNILEPISKDKKRRGGVQYPKMYTEDVTQAGRIKRSKVFDLQLLNDK